MPSRTSNNSSVTKVESTPQTMPAERHKYGHKKAPVNVQQGRMDGFNTITDKKVVKFVVNNSNNDMRGPLPSMVTPGNQWDTHRIGLIYLSH